LVTNSFHVINILLAISSGGFLSDSLFELSQG
jgi:hypothetical protein